MLCEPDGTVCAVPVMMFASLFGPAYAAVCLAPALRVFIVRPNRQMQLPATGGTINDLGMGTALMFYPPS